ncbi:MAG: hypothetical protein GTN80_09190 [Nitrososphaeria archaeon]|nr:hypothetical protein [Nitrososphaeria archaeon]
MEIEKERKSIRIRRGREEVRVETEVLIAADGSFSRTARSIGLDLRASPYNYSPVLQYVMENITVEDDVVEMYMGREYAPGGYTWIIPRGDGTANVGLGIRSPFYERGTTIHEFLQRFIRRHPAASSKLKEGIIISRVGGLMPVGGPIPKTATDDIMVVGDAAGHVMASNGGGVPPALVCGEIAGETAANRINNGVCLSLYEEMWRSEVGEELNTSLKVREMGDLAMKSDDFMNGILEILGPKNIGEMIRCRLPLGLAQLYRLAMKVKKHL